MSVAMAATKIQNLWKGAIARRQVKKQREEELAFIGMVKNNLKFTTYYDLTIVMRIVKENYLI